ncbi:hypothetical protein Y032_0037g3487 [Ancylostoma ceylanicum]|uniref:Uncharacterized protein n=1 Tax=Ancylostoma ceylanicum TaxID=53326 RepID=A0A016ULH8_9BILA|nr:hypothetical protein Y032_0037g3487 [Ancylostoma ceylanicum]
MRGSRRGTFPSRPAYPERGVEFFPRGRDDSRRPRNAPAPYSHDNRSDPGYARSGRDPDFSRRKDLSNGRTQESFLQNNDRRGSQYISSERGAPSYGSRGYGPSGSSSNSYPISGESRMPPNENDNRYKYLNDGWYNEYKTTSSSGTAPPQPNPYRGREQRDPRNGYGTQTHARENVERFRGEKNSHSASDPSNISKYGYVNPSIARETRELEQRMAAIQRELDMLETDKKGSRSPDFHGSGRERRVRNEPHPPARSSSRSFPPRPDAAQQARIEREQEILRRRERELARREEELMRKERRLRERTPPRPVRAPAQPVRITTFPKSRPFDPRIRRPIRSKRVERILDNLDVSLPEKRRVIRTRDLPVREEQRSPPKRRVEIKRDYKEEQDVSASKAAGTEGNDSLSEQAVAKLLERTIGTEVLDDYEPPRQRALSQLLRRCDRKLLTGEVLKKFGVVEADAEPVDLDSYRKRTCTRMHNPTTFGPLDQFVPLRTFEEDVAMEASDTEHEEVLENLKAALGFFPRSPPP